MAENGWGRAPECGHIVVGVNRSQASLAAMLRAIADARRTGSGLLAVHAWKPPAGERRVLRQPGRDAVTRALGTCGGGCADGSPTGGTA